MSNDLLACEVLEPAPSGSRAIRLPAGSKKAASLPSLAQTLLPAPPSERVVLALDELWSFVGKKANNRWVWLSPWLETLARCSPTLLAERSANLSLGDYWWQRIPQSYKKGRCYSDLWEEPIRASFPKSVMRRWPSLPRTQGGTRGGRVGRRGAME